jgi:hypothetical protein
MNVLIRTSYGAAAAWLCLAMAACTPSRPAGPSLPEQSSASSRAPAAPATEESDTATITTAAAGTVAFPVAVSADVSRDQGTDAKAGATPQLVAKLTYKNTGPVPIRYDEVKVHFVNPTTHKDQSSVISNPEKDASGKTARELPYVLNQAAEGHDVVATGGDTKDLLAGLAKDAHLDLLVEFVSAGTVVGRYRATLPDASGKPAAVELAPVKP